MPSGALHYLITDWATSPEKEVRWTEFLTAHCDIANGQTEKGGESGRVHYQIYFKLKSKHTKDWIKKQLEDKALHIEVCVSPLDAFNYGGKDETRVAGGWALKFGEPPVERGHRSDLDSLQELIRAGGPRAVWDARPGDFIKYSRGISAAHELELSKHSRTWKTRVWVFMGPPGCGKTSLAKSIAAELGYSLHTKLKSEKWFDRYDPLKHECVLLDDFNGSMPYGQLLGIMDRDEAWVEVKGATLPWLAKHLFITLNCHWEELYDFQGNKKIDKSAFHRRVDSWWDAFADPYFNVKLNIGPGFPPLVQGPRSPVILGGDLGLSPLYHGEGKWTFSEIRVTEDSE